MSRNARPARASVRSVNYASSPLLASKTPPWRSRFAVALVGLAFAVLLGRAVWIQVIGSDFYQKQGEKRFAHQLELPASRGRILDRNGLVLATSVPTPSVWALPKDFQADPTQRRALARLLGMSTAELDARLEGNPNFAWLRRQVDESVWEQVKALGVKGVHQVREYKRRYPEGEAAAHVVGFTNIEDQGLEGIELRFQNQLQGRDGLRFVAKDRLGRVVEELADQTDAVNGDDIQLAIDSKVQFFAYQRLRDAVNEHNAKGGSVVVLDAQTGEVLALANYPSFSPGGERLSQKDERRRNRALTDVFEPGSTMKPFIGLAGLELGLRRPADTVYSSGAFRLPGQQREYRDWRRGGHGTIDLRESLAQSVNTYYYQLALDLGIERMTQYTAQFGFGAPTGIDLVGEAGGILPTPAWKRAARNQPWYPGETVIAGIGQGFWVTTPLQLAQGMATLASGGQRRAPHLLRAVQQGFDAEIVDVPPAELGPPIPLRPENLGAVVAGMEAVMHAPTGTARAYAADSPYRIAGKTGTAQRVGRTGDTEVDQSTLSTGQRNLALFVAFAPADAPTIALVIVIEGGGSGTRAAAPVARQILDAWILREPT